MDRHDEIATIEDEIDQFAEAAERCRKVMTLARLSTIAGSVMIVAFFLGLFRMDAPPLLAALTAVLAGIAVYGSHRSTLLELKGKIAARDAERAALIDELELRPLQRS